MTTTSPIARLRRAEAVLRQSGDAACMAVADGLRMHVHEGVALPRALGLIRYGGGGSPAVVERRAERDRLLRELHRRYWPDLGPMPAAVAILTALAEQERARGRVVDDQSRRLETLVQSDPGVPSSVRQLRKILALNSLF